MTVLILLWIALGRERLSHGWEGWILAAPIALLALAFGLHSNPVLLVINFLIIPPLFIVHAMMVGRFNPVVWWRATFINEFLEMIFYRVFSHFDKPIRLISGLLKPATQEGSSQTVRGIALGLLLAIPLMFIVVPLLSSADLVFEGFVQDIAVSLNLDSFDQLIYRVIIISLVLLAFFGLVWSIIKDEAQKAQALQPTARNWGSTASITILAVTNLVYLAFIVIQVQYLYGFGDNPLPEGFTYSEYARRGFWELLTVSAINLSLLLAFMAKVKNSSRTSDLIMKVSMIALVLFAMNLLFAAHWKMSLYEAVFGLTYLRVFVHYFMALLLVLFILPLIKLTIGRVHLIKSYLVAALSFYVVLNYIGVDQIIASHNLDKYTQTGKIDVSYLTGLSDDAIPVLVNTRVDLSASDRRILDSHLLERKHQLDRSIPWQSATLSRARAHESLQILEPDSRANSVAGWRSDDPWVTVRVPANTASSADE